MKIDLENNWGIAATTLYDRPLRSDIKILDRDVFLRKYNERKVDKN
jgi:hypothetical protein